MKIKLKIKLLCLKYPIKVIEINHYLGRETTIDIKVSDQVKYLRPKINYNDYMPLRKYYVDEARKILKKQRDEKKE